MATFREALGSTMSALPQVLQMYQQAYMQSRQLDLEERRTTAAEKESAANVKRAYVETERAQEELRQFREIFPRELAIRDAEQSTAEAKASMAKLEAGDFQQKLDEAHELHAISVQAQQEAIDTARDTRLTNETTRRLNDISSRIAINEANISAMKVLEVATRDGFIPMADAFWAESSAKHNGLGVMSEVKERLLAEGMLKTPEEIRAFEDMSKLTDTLNSMTAATAASIGTQLLTGEIKSFKWTGADGTTYDMDAGRWFNGGSAEYIVRNNITPDQMLANIRNNMQAPVPSGTTDKTGEDWVGKAYGAAGAPGVVAVGAARYALPVVDWIGQFTGVKPAAEVMFRTSMSQGPGSSLSPYTRQKQE